VFQVAGGSGLARRFPRRIPNARMSSAKPIEPGRSIPFPPAAPGPGRDGIDPTTWETTRLTRSPRGSQAVRRRTPGVHSPGSAPPPAARASESGTTASEQTATSDAGDPEGEVRLFVADRYESVRQLDPDTLETVATLDVGLRPHGLIASPDARHLYITVETTNELVKVDVGSHEIVDRVEVGPVPNEPAITHDGRHVIVPIRGGPELCDIVDTRTMEVVKQLPAGTGQHNAYVSADGSVAIVTSMGDNFITVIDTASMEVERRIELPGIPRPVALTDDLSLAYVALSGLTGFITVDFGSGEVVDRLELEIPAETPPPPLQTYTHGLLLTPDERELWVAAYATDTVHAFAVPERRHFAEIEVPGGPHWFTLHPDGEPLYVTLEDTGRVAAIHRGLREVTRVAEVGQGPTRILAFRAPVDR